MRASLFHGLLLCLGICEVASAQTPTGNRWVDSAAIARAAWARGRAAASSGDVAQARNELERAAQAWPTQPAYVWAHAVMAARAHDTAAVKSALDAYADLGLGRDLRRDSLLAPYAGLPGFADIVRRHDTNRSPIAHSTRAGALRDSAFWPEGLDFDTRTGRFYVASVRRRTIAELGPDGSVRELWPSGLAGMGSMLGVRVDPAEPILWATTSGLRPMLGYAAGDSAIAALLRIRIADGAIERRWDLPPRPGGHTLGDLAVGNDGDVFVTDSNEPVLYRLRAGSDSLLQIRHPLFRSLQGVAVPAHAAHIYVADYSHGLLRVVPESGAVTRLEDAPGSTSLGCDGIAWHHDSIICVQNGVVPARVMRFRLDAGGRSIVDATMLDRNSTIADEPTIGTIVGAAFVYVANSQWEKYDDAGNLRPGAILLPPVLLSIPLR